MEQRKYQWMLSHIVTPQISHHHYTENVMRKYPAILRSAQHGNGKMSKIVRKQNQSFMNGDWDAPFDSNWSLFRVNMLQMWVIFASLTRLHGTNHSFYCGWGTDSGGRIKCARSLMSTQTCLNYKHKQALFPLSRGRATFIRAHAAFTESEDLLCNFCIMFIGCVSSMFLHEG